MRYRINCKGSLLSYGPILMSGRRDWEETRRQVDWPVVVPLKLWPHVLPRTMPYRSRCQAASAALLGESASLPGFIPSLRHLIYSHLVVFCSRLAHL